MLCLKIGRKVSMDSTLYASALAKCNRGGRAYGKQLGEMAKALLTLQISGINSNRVSEFSHPKTDYEQKQPYSI